MDRQTPNISNAVICPPDSTTPDISWGGDPSNNSGTGLRGSFASVTASIAGTDRLALTATGAAVTGSISATAGIVAGGGTTITKVLKGVVAVTIPALLTATNADITVTIAGATAGDVIQVTPLAAAMEANVAIVGAFVSTTNSVKIRIANIGAGTLTGSTSNFSYLITQS